MSAAVSPAPFRVGCVTGATPDQWARTWRERSRVPLELVPVAEPDQEVGVRAGELDMAFARLPVDRDVLACIPLYDELPVAVVAADHWLSLAEQVTTDDLAGEQLVLAHHSGWRPATDQRAWPPVTAEEAIGVAASGAGIAVVPMSVARFHARRDAVHRVVTDLPATRVGLVWLLDNDDPRVQTFIGIVRGRTANSSRR